MVPSVSGHSGSLPHDSVIMTNTGESIYEHINVSSSLGPVDYCFPVLLTPQDLPFLCILARTDYPLIGEPS